MIEKLWHRKTIMIIGVGFLMFLLSSPLYGPRLLSRMGNYLVTDEVPEKTDAIVILSGSVPDRALEARDLYQQGLAPKIFLTKGKRSDSHRYVESGLGIDLPEEYEINETILRRLGVPEEAICKASEEIDCTEDEALVLQPLFKTQKISSILLVTSKFHTKRAGKVFRWILGKDVRVIPVPSRYDTFNPSRWWRKREDARHVAFEYQKLLVFYLSRIIP